MSDELIIRNCSPTLAGIKTGSIFSCPYRSNRELMDDIRSLNRRLVPKGLRVLPLRCTEKRALIYVFRANDLRRDLSNQAVIELLRKRGYRDIRLEPCVCQLIGRFRENGEFPHEIGVFLGYPPEDVCGFIENKACGHKCVGCWKVYGDEKAARKTFEKYKATPHNCVCGSQRIFCAISAVPKTGNTYSIPPFLKL